MSIRLAYQDRLYGVLAVSIPGKFVTDEEEQDLFREVAGDVSFALHDIEIEEEHQQAEGQLCFQAILLDQIRDAIVATDLEGRITYTNEASVQILGRPKEELVGQTVHAFGENPVKGATQQEIIDQTRAHGEWRGQVVNYDRDGAERVIDARTWLLYDENGTPSGMAGISTEITEWKQMQEALQAAHKQLAATLNALPDILFEIDREGHILDFRAHDPEALYAPPEAFLGQLVEEILPDAAAQVVTEAIAEAAETGRHFGATYPLEMEGQSRWFELSIASKNGDRLIALARDVTERKQAEEQIKASLQEKEVLIQEIHHRVKNNLQIIFAMLDFQANASEDERLSQVLQRVQNRVFALAHVYEHLHRSPNLAWINMANYVRCLVEHAYQTHNVYDVTIQVDVDDVILGIDAANPCGLIVNELVANALQHAFPPDETLMEGEPSISVTLQQDEASDQLVLTVGDNGIGLSEKDWQQPSSMGLRIVKLLTRQLEGKIEMETGVGTTFKIRFPMFTN